ncbi:MAG: DUF72 domain-containing protein [Firmicutes bacterium]|nr:DUF72 domain-containing protein [Bacillota bacterium]
MASYYIGTCSFTDKGLDGTFYPKGIKPAERISFYAQHFNCVEIDSSYYSLPSERNSVLFAQRTPDDFVFHFKAFGLMTKHKVMLKSLGRALAIHLPPGYKAPYIEEPPRDMLEKAFNIFYSALNPLRIAGKLGLILFQFPPYFTKSKENKNYILQCQEWMKDSLLAIEFRHKSWVDNKEIEDTMRFLRDHNLVYVSVDEPQFASGLTIPPIARTTAKIAYVRFHGRNTKNWFKKGITVAERFDYLYSLGELKEWVSRIEGLAKDTDQVHIMFNNCMNTYPVQNARDMAGLLNALPGKKRVELIDQRSLDI